MSTKTLLENVIKSKVTTKQFKKLSQLTLKDLRNGWKFCDPCCGRGFIIFDVVELLVKNIGEEYRQEIMDAMYGMDIEPHFIKLLKALGYKNVKVGDASNPKDWFLDTYNITMKFDCIIMNPPYQRDLHLKILKEVQNHINLAGKIICLHPSKWIKRFDYWKNKWNMFKVENVEFIDEVTSRTIFSAEIGSQLSITLLSNNGSTDYKKYSNYIPWVKEKIIDVTPFLLNDKKAKFRTTNKNEQYILNLPIVHGNTGCFDMTEITSKVYARALKVKFGKRLQDINSLAFNTEKERKHFYDSTFTNFYKFLIITCRDGQTATSCYYALPIMEDYSQPWTDERFYKFFNITKEEQKIIEDTMAKYK